MKKIGVGVFVKKQDEILLGMRGYACKNGAGCWALPGGMVENNETIIEGSIREVWEESGVKIKPVDSPSFCVPGCLALTEHRYHITAWMIMDYVSGDPTIKEPEKCIGWMWKKPKNINFKNMTKEQVYWTPYYLWKKILFPYFGDI